jgi:hypothetical protein
MFPATYTDWWGGGAIPVSFAYGHALVNWVYIVMLRPSKT